MGAIVQGYNFLIRVLAVVSGILIFTSFVMICVDVSMRILGFNPPIFTIGVVEYTLLWFAVLAAPWITRIKGHVFIDAVTQFLPPAVKFVVAKIVYCICIFSCLVFAWYSWENFWTNWQSGTVDVRGVDLPLWLLFVPMAPCFVLVAIEFGRFLIGIDDMYSHSIEEREGV